MENKDGYFSKASKLFWGLISLLIIFTIFKFNAGVFKNKNLADDLIRQDSLFKAGGDNDNDFIDSLNLSIDSLNIHQDSLLVDNDTNPIDNNEMETSNWNWVDFNGKTHNITFSFPKNSLQSAQQNRTQSYNYSPLYEHDKSLLSDLINQMKREIKNDNLNYIGAIEYVCSSIQYIPYTLVLNSSGIEFPPLSRKYVKCPCQTSFGYFNDNCDSKVEFGCCNDIDPFGVYSPFEFAYKKTGDCDTRSLLAFTLLKEMGFDVAVMTSNSEGHSVLGITLGDPSRYSTGRNMYGKKYVLWELTSPNWRLEYPVEGNDWIAALE